MKFKLSIRNTVILFNTVLLTVTVGLVILVNTNGAEASIYFLANNLMREITKSAVNKTSGYLQPAERAVEDLAYHYFSSPAGTNVIDDRGNDAYLRVLLTANPEFRAVYFADPKGNLAMERRMPDETISQRVIHRRTDGVHVDWHHDNMGNYADYPDKVVPLATGYNPVKRSWFITAVARRSLTWTSVYVFASDKMPGLSCVEPVYAKNGSLLGVCAIDIGILDLSYFLKTLSTTAHAKVFFLDSKRRVLGLPLSPSDSLNQLFLKKPSGDMELRTLRDLQEPLYDEAWTQFTADGHPNHPFSFSMAGKQNFAMFSSVPDHPGLDLSFGIIIPDHDLTGGVRENMVLAIGVSVMMLLIAVLLSVFLSAAIANPMRLLIQEMDKVRNFILESEYHAKSLIREIGTLGESFATMKQGLKNFRKYVPADLVHQLIRLEKDATLGGERRELAMFFSDIANFTAITEQVAPEELVGDLCEYFAIVSKAIEETQGTLDKYIGDSVMAFWGAPEPVEDHVAQACYAALKVRNDLQVLFLVWENRGKPRLNTRIGLHVGEVIAGNMGYERRMNYTILGDGVNLTSRMEGLNKFYGTQILVTGQIVQRVGDQFEFRRIDKVAVKGKTEVIEVFELVAQKDQISTEHRKTDKLYEAGLDLYFKKDWNAAGRFFIQVLKARPHDGPARTLVERCRKFLKTPPPADWDGVYHLDEK